jgi:hypothetical protein
VHKQTGGGALLLGGSSVAGQVCCLARGAQEFKRAPTRR